MTLFLYPLDEAVARAIETSHIPARSRLGVVVVVLESLLAVVILSAAILTSMFGLGYVVLANDSMSPSLPAGTLAVTSTVDAASLEVGDVVTVPAHDGALATYRVTELAPAATADARLVSVAVDGAPGSAALEVASVGRVVAAAPGLGTAVATAGTPALYVLSGLMLLVILAQLPRKRSRALHAA